MKPEDPAILFEFAFVLVILVGGFVWMAVELLR